VQDGYGRWLTFLERNGGLDADATPAARLTPERLRTFIAELQATVAPLTVRNRIRDLAAALRVMAAEADLSYLHHADRRIAEKHYDQARDTRAVGLWQEHVQAERRRIRDDKRHR
jgi:hypothetical protein